VINPSLDPAAAYQTGAAWLSALRARDQARLVSLSAPDLEVLGFTLPNGPETDGCGSPNATVSQRNMTAADGAPLPKVIDCLTRDNLLVGNIPPMTDSEWSERMWIPQRGSYGYLRFLDLDATMLDKRALHARLSKYRKLVPTDRTDIVPMTFFVTDNSGGTSYGVMLVRSVDGRPLVSRVFIDEDFQC